MYSISISSKVYFLPLISCIKNKGVSFKYDKHLYTSKMLKVSSDFQCYKFEIKNKVLIVDWMNGDDKRRLCFHRFGGFFFQFNFYHLLSMLSGRSIYLSIMVQLYWLCIEIASFIKCLMFLGSGYKTSCLWSF